MDENGNALTKLLKVKLAIGGSIGCASLILILFPLFVVVLLVLGLFDGSGSSGGTVASNNGECGFTISQTSLSKSEFKRLIQEYAKTDGNSHWQIFADFSDDYYDYAKAKGVNPELVVTVAGKENGGKETTPGTNNYWGWGCPNNATACEGLDNFMIGAKNVIDSASKWDTIYNWFYIGHYSWIGDYWLNPGGSGVGGCYYAEHIYPDNMPTRVKNACAPGNECSGSNCQPTVPEEDQAAYSDYLINVMLSFRRNIFKLEDNEGVSCTYGGGSGVVESYVQWMIDVANDNTHGYSQYTSDGGSGRGFNPDVDCSSFVYYALLKGAGFSEEELGINSPFSTTYKMDETLKKVGFKVYNYTSQDDLQRGDILWRSSHTEVYIGDGQNVGAHSNYNGKVGDGNGEEVDIGNNGNDWTYYYRYEGGN